jgi:hypothetical protein
MSFYHLSAPGEEGEGFGSSALEFPNFTREATSSDRKKSDDGWDAAPCSCNVNYVNFLIVRHNWHNIDISQVDTIRFSQVFIWHANDLGWHQTLSSPRMMKMTTIRTSRTCSQALRDVTKDAVSEVFLPNTSFSTWKTNGGLQWFFGTPYSVFRRDPEWSGFMQIVSLLSLLP